MRRYHVRVEFEANRSYAIGYGSVDAEEFDRLGADNAEAPVDVRLTHVIERSGEPEEFERAHGFRFEPGEEVPMLPAELEVVYEFWEPGPGEQRLFEMAQEGSRDG